MYNGIGLETPRGSGTNGYVQRNWAAVRKPKDRTQYKTDQELRLLDEASNKQPNREILDHESKRKIEIKCLQLADALTDQGFTSDEIAQKVDDYRKTLIGTKKPVDEIPRDEYGRVAVKETHQIAEAQQEKNAKLREAFGISEYFVEGSSLDPQRKAKEALAKAAAEPVYALVRTPSPDRKVSKEDNQKLKSRDSASTPEKKKEKKKKSKKRKKKSDHDGSSKSKKKKKSSSKKNKKKKHEESSDDSSNASDDSTPEKRRSSPKRAEKIKATSKNHHQSRSPSPRKEFTKSKHSPAQHRPRNRSESYDDHRNRNSSRKRKDKSPVSNHRRKESVSPPRKKKSVSPVYHKSKRAPSPYLKKKSVSPSSRKRQRSPSPPSRYKDASSGRRKERKSVSPPLFKGKRSTSPYSSRNKESASPKYDKSSKNPAKKKHRHSSESSVESKEKSYRKKNRHEDGSASSGRRKERKSFSPPVIKSKRSTSPFSSRNRGSVSPKHDKTSKNPVKKRHRHSSASSIESREISYQSSKRKVSKSPPRSKHPKNVSRSRSKSASPPPKRNKYSYSSDPRNTENSDYRKVNGSKYRSENESKRKSHKKNNSRLSHSLSRSKSPPFRRSSSGSPPRNRSKYFETSKHRNGRKKMASRSPSKDLKHKSRKSKRRSRSNSSSGPSYSPLTRSPERYRDIIKPKIPQPQPVVRLRSFSSENEGVDSVRKKTSTDEESRRSALDFLQSALSAKVKESVEKKLSSNKNNTENSDKDKSSILSVCRSSDTSTNTVSKQLGDPAKKSPVPINSPSKINFSLQSATRKLSSPALVDEIEVNRKSVPSKFVINLDGSPKVKQTPESVTSPLKKTELASSKKDTSASPDLLSQLKALKSDIKNLIQNPPASSLKLLSPGKKENPSGQQGRDSTSPHLCRKSRKRDSNRSGSSSNDEDSPTRDSSSSDSSDSSSNSSDRSSSRSVSHKRKSSSRSVSRDSKHKGSQSRSRSRSGSSRSRSSSASERGGSTHSVGHRASRSSSRSVSPKRRSASRSVSRHSKRSASRSVSRSHSSSRSRSRSPSIPRRKGSPSFLDRRRITSKKSKKHSRSSSSSSKSSKSSSTSSSSSSDSDS